MRDNIETPAPETSDPGRPFFARFLEGQDRSKAQTLKYPSDRDEWEDQYASATTDGGNK